MVLPTTGPLGLFRVREEIRGPTNTAEIGMTTSEVRTFTGRTGGLSVDLPTHFYGKSSIQAPVANFSAFPTTGTAPLTVQFTDQSTNSPTNWTWDFDNNGTTDSTTQSPSYQYSTVGTYTVKLTVTNSGGTNTVTKTSLITVNSPTAAKVAIFGDSVSTYGGVRLIPGQPKNLDTSYSLSQDGSITSIIQKLYPSYNIVNVSRGGMTTFEALGQVPSLGNNPFGSSGTLLQWVTDNSPQKVILRYGLADAVLYPDNASVTINNLNTIISTLINLSVEVILLGVNPIAALGDPVNAGYYQSYGTAVTYSQVQAAQAIHDGIINLANYYGCKFANPRNVTAPVSGLPDGIHPYRNFGFQITRHILQELRNQVPAYEQGTVTTENYYFSGPGPGAYVYEGNTVTYTVQTTGVPNGTILYWAAESDTGMQAIDVSTPLPPLGTVTIGPGGSGTITLTINRDDPTPELDESAYIDIYQSQSDRDAFQNQLAMSNPVLVVDNPYNEQLTGPTSATVNTLYNLYITGSRPNSIFSWNRNWLGPGDIQSATTDSSGSYTFENIFWPDTGYYAYTFTFGNSPARTRNYAVTVYPASAPPSAPVANFTSNVTSGPAPLTVNFTDQSTNGPTSWQWDFTNDGVIDNTSQNPSNIYSAQGIYSVKLIASNSAGSSTITKSNYITVTAPPPPTYSFTTPSTPVSINEGASVSFIVSTTNLATGTTVWWAAFGVNTVSTEYPPATIPDVATPNPPLGSVNINSQGVATIVLTSAEDFFTPEIGEGFYLRLYATQSDRDNFVNHVAQSQIVTIIDVPPYAILTYGINSVYEGDIITFYIRAKPLPPGTIVWWTTTGVAPAASPADINTPFPPLGSVTLNAVSEAEVTFDIKLDGISEPAGEKFYMTIHPNQSERDSYTLDINSVTPLAFSPVITVLDYYGQ